MHGSDLSLHSRRELSLSTPTRLTLQVFHQPDPNARALLLEPFLGPLHFLGSESCFLSKRDSEIDKQIKFYYETTRIQLALDCQFICLNFFLIFM